MTPAEVQQLIADNPRLLAGAKVVETHISWVILSPRFAYKIKKPVTFSFLDFSSLEKRKFYCQRELILNNRLTNNIYLDVQPILRQEGQLHIGNEAGSEIVDYAVKMQRLDSERQMDLLLEKGLVDRQHMVQLAEQIAHFHMSTEVVSAHPNLKNMQEDFADLEKISPFLTQHLGSEASEVIRKGVACSKKILDTHQDRIYERHLEGFTVDGHGDLHARNIFLLEEPVIFDCIEFNDHFRHLDVLNELAFLCMDLDVHRQLGLGEALLDEYNERYQCIYSEIDEKIFHYYKLYRANVRLKISALEAAQGEGSEAFEKQLATARQYFDLFEHYLSVCC